jgi:hypothetical protein
MRLFRGSLAREPFGARFGGHLTADGEHENPADYGKPYGHQRYKNCGSH